MGNNKKTSMLCKICGNSYITLRALASHIKISHGLSSEEYTINYLFNKTRPTCQECGEATTRYSSFSFKKFCKKHSSLAEKEGGAKGGKAGAWNKGKTKHNDSRILKQAIEMQGNANHFFGKKHDSKTIEKLSKDSKLNEAEIRERLRKREGEYDFSNFDYKEYVSRQHQKIKCICLKCEDTSYKTLQALERGSLCKKCFPFMVSQAEIEIGDFIKSLLVDMEVIRNTRDVIGPKELDIFVSSKNFAIEYDGLYWHMDTGKKGFNKFAAYDKMVGCKEKGIVLFHIFSDEWNNKKDLIKSMISNRLGLSKHNIGARQCSVCEVNSKEAQIFYNKSHISGYVRSSKNYALKYDDEIVCILSLRKAFHKKYKGSIEISRFASRPDFNIQGGFSKLLKKAKQYAKENDYKSIISYCDKRFGEGNVYIRSGFNLISESKKNYWYTDGVTRFDRFKFRAQNGKAEKKVAKENGVYKIYGCGNNLYELKLV